MWLQKIAARLQRRKWKRAKKEGEKFGQHGVALRIDVQMRRGGLSFKGGRQGRPLLHALQVANMQEGAPPSRGGSTQGGCTLGERGTL